MPLLEGNSISSPKLIMGRCSDAIMSHCPALAELPPPPSGKTGWPWTEETLPLPEAMPDGSPWPMVSIVTPSYNQGKFIEETIRSILLQGYPNLEYIVIDGGSTDGSAQIIQKYASWLKCWVSEPDRGQSHAINKGLKHCSGEIFNWINSDDLLAPGALRTVAMAWGKTPNSIIAGAAINFDEAGCEDLHSPNAITLENFFNWRKARECGWMWQQPSTFLPGAEVSRVGGVREDLQFSMDHFLMIDLLQRCEVVYVPDVLARFRLHSDSKTLTFGTLQFSLERLAKLKTIINFQKYITTKELKELHVSVLLTFADLEWREGRHASACHSFAKALAESPLLAMRVILRRSTFGQIFRRVIAKVNTNSEVVFPRSKSELWSNESPSNLNRK